MVMETADHTKVSLVNAESPGPVLIQTSCGIKPFPSVLAGQVSRPSFRRLQTTYLTPPPQPLLPVTRPGDAAASNTRPMEEATA